MPTFYGPWIDPGPMWVTVIVTGPHQVDRGRVDPTGDAAADEATPQSTIASPPNALQARATAIGAPAWSYDQATARISFNQSDLIYLPPGGSFPAGAFGAEIEPPRLGVFLGPTVAHLAANSVAAGPGTDMTATNWAVYDADGWTRSSTLAAGLTARATVNFAATDIPVNLVGSDYTLTGTTDQHRAHSLLVVADRQVSLSHLATPGGTDTDTATVTIDPVTVAVFAHPPRYRFLYDRQRRLRQYPRDDSLGGAPRQGRTNGATSVQGSTRQGWRGTYR